MNTTKGLAQSVHVRLVAKAKELSIEAQLLLERYALHRFLYRLSESEHARRFLLKGAQLMLVWIGETVRVTRDADLLGFGELSDETLGRIFKDVCNTNVDNDGMIYLTDSIRIVPIREENIYGGRRTFIDARLGNAQLRVQIDVGVGDAVTPEPVWVELQPLLDLPKVRLRAYRPETSIAEKLESIVTLGLLNSRMKDYFDIYVLSKHKTFDYSLLSQAVHSTFERRRTPIPDKPPPGLTNTFADEPGKAAQWQSFLNKIAEHTVPDDLADAVHAISTFLGPILRSTHRELSNDQVWPPGGPWKPKEE